MASGLILEGNKINAKPARHKGRPRQMMGAFFGDFGRRFLERGGKIFGAQADAGDLVILLTECRVERQRVAPVPGIIDQRVDDTGPEFNCNYFEYPACIDRFRDNA